MGAGGGIGRGGVVNIVGAYDKEGEENGGRGDI